MGLDELISLDFFWPHLVVSCHSPGHLSVKLFVSTGYILINITSTPVRTSLSALISSDSAFIFFFHK